MTAIMFLPRQFQILVVENVNEEHVRTAVWLFPLYLFAMNLFVIPIAFAGVILFPSGTLNPDTIVLTLPLSQGRSILALFVFIGGLSAATGMVIVESIALSTMLCNDLLVPILLQLKLLHRDNMGGMLLALRRGSILAVLLLGYLYFRLIGESYALVSIGLVSFAAAAQFAPAILFGIYWKGASRSGALAGLFAGFAVWIYTLLLPSFATSGWIPMSFVEPGPFGIAMLGAYHLFNLTGFDPITHSVFWSMLFNVGFLVGVSLFSRQKALDQFQAAMFVDVYRRVPDAGDTRLWQGTTRLIDLKNLVGRMIGPERTERAFQDYARQHSLELSEETLADANMVEFAERELAGTIGAASARVMISSIVEGEALSIDGLMRIMDETSQVIEYSHKLEQKSSELEAATRELKRTNERLKELDRLKDDFVSTISHELRTPLTSIRSFSEILQDDIDIDPEQRKHFLGIVVKETERLTRLVNQVLDFSKIESGVLKGAREEVNLINVVQEALAATSQLSRDKNVSITSELPGGPVTATADRDMLVQVIINLLSNAIKFCDSDTGRVHIRLASGLKEVRIEVSDNGPGIQPEERGHIFEKFHQLSDTIKGKPHGTGLGLAICKTIIENHGGHIWVESNDEKGSVFIFTLPVTAK
jgi:signal transduction histidine kinase